MVELEMTELDSLCLMNDSLLALGSIVTLLADVVVTWAIDFGGHFTGSGDDGCDLWVAESIKLACQNFTSTNLLKAFIRIGHPYKLFFGKKQVV